MKKFLLFMVLPFLFSCKSSVLDASDSGKIVKLKLGQSVEIMLPENPTTGFRWHFETEPAVQMVVYQVSDKYIAPNTKRVGAGGEHLFVYQATGEGKVKVCGFHSRPWESENRSDKPTVEYEIVVEP